MPNSRARSVKKSRALLPHRREDAGLEFWKGKGLGNKIMGAEIEGPNFFLDGTVGREDDHGNVRNFPRCFERSLHVQSVHAGQAQIEKHHVEDPVVNLFQCRDVSLAGVIS